MKMIEGRLVGILGTVIIHLIAAILFMSFRLASLHTERQDLIQVELAPDQITEPLPAEKQPEPAMTTVEKVMKGDEELLNIARNLANKSEQKINPADYIDKVKEELIKSGKLGRDNFIDEQKKQPAAPDAEDIITKKEDSTGFKKRSSENSQEMAANYKGPTRIYYNLPGRTHTYLPVPIYKCQGEGIVVLSIYVNQKGEVEKATIIENESTTSDPCLVETAVTTALVSRFNADVNSPRSESGTLTYHFVAQ
jgi:outer membrane biosynthesis protein TonB